MGCWNGSCHFSGLPIKDGEPAVAIPVVIKDSAVLPTLFPFYGKYNDYGSLEDVQSTTATRKAVELFIKYGRGNWDDLPKFPQQEELDGLMSRGSLASPSDGEGYVDLLEAQRSHCKKLPKVVIRLGKDALDKYAITNEASLIRAMEREGCRGGNLEVLIDGVFCPITMVLVHGEVWEHLKRHFLLESLMEYPPKTGSDFLTKILLDFANECRDKVDTDDEVFNGIHRYQNYSKFTRDILGRFSDTLGYEDVFKQELWESIGLDIVGGTLTGDALEAAKDVLAFRMISYNLRRGLTTTYGAGSQAESYESIRALARASLAVADKHLEEEPDE